MRGEIFLEVVHGVGRLQTRANPGSPFLLLFPRSLGLLPPPTSQTIPLLSFFAAVPSSRLLPLTLFFGFLFFQARKEGRREPRGGREEEEDRKIKEDRPPTPLSHAFLQPTKHLTGRPQRQSPLRLPLANEDDGSDLRRRTMRKRRRL